MSAPFISKLDSDSSHIHLQSTLHLEELKDIHTKGQATNMYILTGPIIYQIFTGRN
jgi:hypothetical protein